MTLRPNDFDRNGDIIPDAMREDNAVRLIDANALYRQVKTECNPYGKPTIDFESGKRVLDIIDNEPTVETYTEEDMTRTIKENFDIGYEMAKNKYERPKGEWISMSNGNLINCGRKCSICGYVVEFSTNYCPNCGADMRKGGAE